MLNPHIMKNSSQIALLPLFVLVIISCGTEKIETTEAPVDNLEIETKDVAPLNFENLEFLAYPDAIIEMHSPLGNENFQEGAVPFEFNIKNYPFQDEPKGFLLRMSVNGDNPVSHHMPIFKENFTTGTYRSVAYLIDPEGIALKEFGNYVDRDFLVGDSQPFPESDEPYMVINLPDNDQVFAAGEDVIIDYLLIGGDLKEDKLKFIVSVNGHEHEIKDLAPLQISNLEAGEHEVRVRLVRENGDELDGIFSSGKRNFIVQ